jgi:hypothetical protein
MAFSELRVHGVSGTPPRELLYSDPVSYDHTDPYARVYEANRDGPGVKAFHWGSLTSGTRATAFWLLLTPFMLANLAGWMAPTRRWVQAFIRLTGLSISALLVAQGAVVLINYVNQIVAGQTYHNLAVAGGAIALGLGYLTIVWRLSTQSLVEKMSSPQKFWLLMGASEESLCPPDIKREEIVCHTIDPAPGAKLADRELWVRQSVLHRLRRQHLSAGILVIPIAVELSLGPSPVLPLSLLVALLVVIDMLFFSDSGRPGRMVRFASRFNVHLAFALWGWSVWRLFDSDLPRDSWPHIHQLVLYVAFLTGVGALGTLVTQLVSRKGHPGQSFLPLSALAIASLVGGAMGVAAALFAELASYRFLGDLNPFEFSEGFDISETEIMKNGGAWTVQAMLCFLMAMVFFAALAAWKKTDRPLPEPDHGRAMAVLRRVTYHADWVFGGTGIVAALLAVPPVYLSCRLFRTIRGCDPVLLQDAAFETFLPAVALGIGALMFLALVVAVFPISKGLSVLTLVLSVLIVWLVNDEKVEEGLVWRVPLIDLPVRPLKFLDLCVIVIVFGLAFFIVRSIIGGFGDPEKRRKVGVLWDVGSFWPRWFHPLAPPSYAPHAIKRLRQALKSGEIEVLTAHSQGSVIACVTLGQRRSPVPRAFVTYGSPLGLLYARLFPFIGVQELIEQVSTRAGQGAHWINLWRDTDPLGGAKLPGMGRNRRIEEGVGHSQYELTEAFIEAREDAVAGPTSLTDSGDS